MQPGYGLIQQQNYAEAETHSGRAFRQPKNSENWDARLLSTINNLLAVQYAEGNYATLSSFTAAPEVSGGRLWTDAQKVASVLNTCQALDERARYSEAGPLYQRPRHPGKRAYTRPLE